MNETLFVLLQEEPDVVSKVNKVLFVSRGSFFPERWQSEVHSSDCR